VPAKKVVKFKVGRLMRQNVGDDEEEAEAPPVSPLRRPLATAAIPPPRPVAPAPPKPPKPPPSNSPF
jgi:hypothetical protein